MSRFCTGLLLVLCLGAVLTNGSLLDSIAPAIDILNTLKTVTSQNFFSFDLTLFNITCPLNPAPEIQIIHFLSFFDSVNNNSNSMFEFDDYNKTAGRLMSLANYTRYTPPQMYDTLLKNGAQGIVEKAFAVFPIIPMNVLVYVAAATALVKLDPVLRIKVSALADVMFEAFDYDVEDGVLNKEEVRGMWFTFGVVDYDQLDAGFAALDDNNSTFIEKDEFIDNGVCFFSTLNANDDCCWFLGPDRNSSVVVKYLGTGFDVFLKTLQDLTCGKA